MTETHTMLVLSWNHDGYPHHAYGGRHWPRTLKLPKRIKSDHGSRAGVDPSDRPDGPPCGIGCRLLPTAHAVDSSTAGGDARKERGDLTGPSARGATQRPPSPGRVGAPGTVPA